MQENLRVWNMNHFCAIKPAMVTNQKDEAGEIREKTLCCVHREPVPVAARSKA
jgi:hypothetical protein